MFDMSFRQEHGKDDMVYDLEFSQEHDDDEYDMIMV